ncbi:hypothetical protein LJY25_14565 [Hymenobacter sp. BT175]|uniref:hypothetical protein n=1 Tax=Hymenobacter translucens TaxID=2886507 RepID=UPI001D0EBC3D|nr:hypothetical protein [Hymenobacter translucens]MCC2547675.1 hypothetical protein [Hymenobacter translucens]
MSLEYSKLESDRFNMRIIRGSITKIDPQELLRNIVDEQADVAIIRLPTSQQHQLSQLSVLPFPVIVADTIVVSDRDLRDFPAQPLRNTQIEVRIGTLADTPVLKELIDLTFTDYRTHYNSNPLFDPKLVLDGYKEWAMSTLEPGDGRVCVLFYIDGQPVAYATIELTGTYGEGIIYGARPNVPYKNLYADLVEYTMQYFWDHGLKKARGVTQVQNHGVQRVWARTGFLPQRSYCTVHINALLSKNPEGLEAATAALAQQTAG